MLAVGLSLLAALAYGVADFTGGLGGKRTSPWSVALAAQVIGTAAILVVALAVGGDPSSRDLAWGVAAGVFNGLGTAFLYRGLSGGRMGVVAPVSGLGAAGIPVIVGVLSGERPPLLVWAGILAALPAIWMVSREPDGPDEPGAPGAASDTSSGLLDGVLAGAGFGVMFSALAQIPDEAGLFPLAINQATAGVAILCVALLLRAPWRISRTAVRYGAGAGILAAAATGLFQAATQTGYLTVAGVITSLYPAATVLLAVLVLRERIHRAQAIGLALCAAAITLVALG